MQLKMLYTSASLVVRTASVESQEDFKEKTQRRFVIQSKSRCENDNAWVTLSVCWKMIDSNTSILTSKDAVNDREEHLDSKIQT